jgi:hypothetical protein
MMVYVELDTGEIPYRRILPRFHRYGKLLKENESVVWVALTEQRMQGLINRSERLNGKGLFTVLGSKHWTDTDGEKITWNDL